MRAASRRLFSSKAGAFRTRINYTSTSVIELALRDPAAASDHFWQPTREYNQLFAELGLRHAREEYGWGDDFAAAIKAEAPDERRRRVSEFRTWTAKLMREQDEQALTVDKAKQAIALLDKEPTMMPVASARGMDDATLDEMGFTSLAHESAVSSWDDWRLEPKSTAQLYAAETAALVKEHTGASHVFCTPRKLRATDGAKGAQPPLHGVHADFGPGYVDELAGVLDGSEPTPQAMTLGLAKQLSAAGITATELRASRVVVLNSWRALGEAPTVRQPLALVDRRTVEAEDVAMIEMPPGVSSAHALRLSYAKPREAHRWYWWPELTSSEVLLFTQFDSADPRGCRMLHSSVHHPQTPEDAPPRRSVELRMLAIFEA